MRISKYGVISFGVIVLGLFLAASGFVSAAPDTYQYGMMGANGQFYPAANSGYGYGGMGGMMQMMSGYGGYGYGVMLLSWVTYLLIIALIIAAIYWLVSSANRKSTNKRR